MSKRKQKEYTHYSTGVIVLKSQFIPSIGKLKKYPSSRTVSLWNGTYGIASMIQYSNIDILTVSWSSVGG